MQLGFCAWVFQGLGIVGLLPLASPWLGLEAQIPQVALFSNTKKHAIQARGCRSYRPLSKSVIELDHSNYPSKPFTQGLTIRLDPSCKLGKKLETCLESSGGESLRECYVKQFRDCNVTIYESSGLFGNSYIRRVASLTPPTIKYAMKLGPHDFAEGIDYLPSEERILMGTWTSNKLLVVEDTGKELKVEKVYQTRIGQHWGIASNGTDVWLTTGEPKAFVFKIKNIVNRNDGDFVKESREITLQDCHGEPIKFVNEMAYDFDRVSIWGNIWGSDAVKQFNPANGKCRGELLLKSLSSREPSLGSTAETRRSKVPEAVWNGIVYLGDDWFLVTGKFFLKLFVFKIEESPL